MADAIELHGFMGLQQVFRDRQWSNPHRFPLDRDVTGTELLELLHIEPAAVEVMFVNRKAHAADLACIRPGDRVALVPPGVPGPHRFLLGFKNR